MLFKPSYPLSPADELLEQSGLAEEGTAFSSTRAQELSHTIYVILKYMYAK